MWTPARLETLKTLWAEGYTASQIANQIGGVSRNAVIGIVFRRGYTRRLDCQSNSTGRVERVRRKRAAAVAKIPTRVVRPARPETLSAERQLAKLLPALGPELTKAPDGLCKFIPGDPLIDASICGRATGHGPYCVQHLKLCYEPSKPKPRVRSVRTDERRRWLRQLEASA